MNTLKFQIKQPSAQNVVDGIVSYSVIKQDGGSDSVKTPQTPLFSRLESPKVELHTLAKLQFGFN